ncbi:hypothetical protein GPOL_c26660 [Gordonia polyisoprenivorans VH2]|uniref:Uncharacterized protein n=1 Tax=Gordonia polyisoprenivorans (strain DSM 44266 / VH2) TaxID=1112204 RepID=H6MQZ0_GORPV|nr:hypothetical protein [Gordonia polyisoprenivorans]AFA73687.1 hypothetical protein GPOL_c26660 [Gordonia polyisoprenivorans VH2]
MVLDVPHNGQLRQKEELVKRSLITAAGVVALAGVVLAGCGNDGGQKPQTFDVKNGVSGMAARAYSNGTCQFYDATLRPGDDVIIKGSSGAILGKTDLVVNKVDPSSGFCAYDFTVKGVTAGEPAYELTVGDYQPIVVSQQELQADKYFTARSAVQALTGMKPLGPAAS